MQQAREVERLDELGITKGPREQGAGHAFDDQAARAAFVQAALAGVEQRVFGQGAPGGAVGRLHLVVVDLQVRPQHQPGLAAGGNAREPLPHLRVGRARCDAGVGVDHRTRLAAGQRQRLDVAAGALAGVQHTHLLFKVGTGRQQQAHAAGLCADTRQLDYLALQVVTAAGGDQALFVARVRPELQVQVVGDPVGRAGLYAAQVLQGGARAEPDVGVQVLHHRLLTGHPFTVMAVVGFHQHAVHAVLHIDHQRRCFDRAARLVPQLYPHRLCDPVTAVVFTANAQPQAVTAQRVVHPGKRRGILLGGITSFGHTFGMKGQRQAGKQLLALRRVGGIEPAGVHTALRRLTERVQRPACAAQRAGVTAGRRGFGRFAQPDSGRRWRQMAKRLGVSRDPARILQPVAGGQDVGACVVHAQASSASAARTKPVREICRASARSPVSAMQPWSSRITASGSSDSINCR